MSSDPSSSENRALRAFVASLLGLVVLTGCVSDPTGQPVYRGGPSEQPGGVDGIVFTVERPVALPTRLASEPSIGVARDGSRVAVAAPGSTSDHTLLLNGGLLWMSNDGGRTFRLELDTRDQFIAGQPIAGCSCDADTLVQGETVYAVTFHRTVNPTFNFMISASEDGGHTWEVRNRFATDDQPADRPWFVRGPGNDLVIVSPRARHIDDDLAGPTLHHLSIIRSDDGGRTWTPSQPIFVREPNRYMNMGAPARTDDGTILIPIDAQGVEDRFRTSVPEVGRVLPDGALDLVALGPPARAASTFDIALAVLGTTAVVARTDVQDDGSQSLLLQRSDDQGATWSSPTFVTIPGNVLHPWVAMGPSGLVAVAYYASPWSGRPIDAAPDTPWMPQVALFRLDDLVRPVAVLDLSGEATYHGVLCNLASWCPDDNFVTPMREFLSADWDDHGNLFVAWTDAREREPPDDATQPSKRGRITVTKVSVTRTDV